MSTSASPAPDSEVRMQVLTKLSVTRRNAIKAITAAGARFNLEDETQARIFREEWCRQMEYWLKRKFSNAPQLQDIVYRSKAYIYAWQGNEGDQDSAKRVRENFLESVAGLTLVMKPRRLQGTRDRAALSNARRSSDANSDHGSEGEVDEGWPDFNNNRLAPATLRAHMLVTLLRLNNSTVAQE
ncbi:hypothetical protein BGX27_001878 [Mortierella sp. AM989]|nr:hypothetical protein BGX27_001878 [Mortierella sp. AM989]